LLQQGGKVGTELEEGGEMRLGTFGDTRRDFDELVTRVLGSEAGGSWPSAGYNVPTDVFHDDDRLIIRMDLPEVDPGEVEVTVQ